MREVVSRWARYLARCAAARFFTIIRRRDRAVWQYQCAYGLRVNYAPLARLMALRATRTVLVLLEKTPPARRNALAERLIDLLPRVSAGAAVQFLHRVTDFGVPMTGKRRQVLAWHYSQAGYYREALDLYREVLCQDPKFVYALYGLAWCHTRLNHEKEAESALDRLLAVQPEHTRGLTLKCWLRMKQGRAAEAIKLLEPLSLRKRNRQEIWTYLAWCCFQEKRYGQSDKAYAQAARLGDMDPAAWTIYGRIKMKLGDKTAAAAMFKKATMLDPTAKEPHLCLAELYAKSGQEREAELERGKVKLLEIS